MATTAKTVAFFGASTGVGLSALRHALKGGCRCVALCRNPSKLTAILPRETTPNLEVVQGNAHDAAAVSRCLRRPKAEGGGLVDTVVFTIGGRFIPLRLTIDDPHVCERGIEVVIEAIAGIRRELGAAAGEKKPHVIVCSGAGISKLGRDMALAVVPVNALLRVPHADKRAMEDRLVKAGGGEGAGYTYTIARPTLLVDGETDRDVRIGVEDPAAGTRESTVFGYTISREDTGKWIARNLVLEISGRPSSSPTEGFHFVLTAFHRHGP